MAAFFITKNSKSPKVFPHSGLTAPDVTNSVNLSIHLPLLITGAFLHYNINTGEQNIVPD